MYPLNKWVAFKGIFQWTIIKYFEIVLLQTIWFVFWPYSKWNQIFNIKVRCWLVGFFFFSCPKINIIVLRAFILYQWEEFITANMIWMSQALSMSSYLDQTIVCGYCRFLLLNIKLSFLSAILKFPTYLPTFHFQESFILIRILRALR